MANFLPLDFFQRALLAGVMLSLLCGMLSVFVILRRMAFIGVGISHSAFGGVALGFLLGIDPLWTGVGFSVVVALLIEWVRSQGRLEEDAAIGIFFAAAMALGVVFLHFSRTYNVDVFGVLFGNILAIGEDQLMQILIVTLVVLATMMAIFKELVFLSFDEEMAWVSGVPVEALRCLFLVIMALVIIASIYLVGIILVSALMVIPGAIARNLTQKIRTMVAVSISAALGSTLGGLYFSYQVDWPSGATVVLLLSLLFIMVALFSRSATRQMG
ncbi:MAG: metal ABC transporter permease [Deltaproteobacteria bacterium]|nr:metal ABC transporter permease [Deltaproteobacteria bacterium]MBW1952196.1 metal ABC transporter permease [Deltaproteobacteria bacterium]MBW1985730.1 metal ABC transporter permease [Deltaproteobacteria bacterium]MBW2134643.1 metal ABC transporter permease [Deltaproteobacteria bacterium]